MSSVDDAAIWDVGDDFIWRVSGMPDVANVSQEKTLLQGPDFFLLPSPHD